MGLTTVNVATSEDLSKEDLLKLRRGLMKAFQDAGLTVNGAKSGAEKKADEGKKAEDSSDDDSEKPAAPIAKKDAPEEKTSEDASSDSDSDEEMEDKTKAAAAKDDGSDSDSDSSEEEAEPAKKAAPAKKDSDSDSDSSSEEETKTKKTKFPPPPTKKVSSSSSDSDGEDEKQTPPAETPKPKPPKKKNQPFRRVRASGKKLESNAWDASKHGGHGAEAFEKLGRHQGKEFIKAKNKRKRSNRSGYGAIDFQVRSTDLTKRRKLN